MCATGGGSVRRVLSSPLSSLLTSLQLCQVDQFVGRFTTLPSPGGWWWCKFCKERIPTVLEVVGALNVSSFADFFNPEQL